MKYTVIKGFGTGKRVTFSANNVEEAQRIALEKIRSKNPFSRKLESLGLYELKEKPQPYETEWGKAWRWEKETGWELTEDEEYIYYPNCKYPNCKYSKKTKEVIMEN